MNVLVAAVGAAILVPFGLAAVSGGPAGPWGHAGFHLGYIATTIVAIILVWLLRRSAESRAVRNFSLALICAQALFLAGQVSELAVVASHNGPQAGENALLHPAHDVALLLTGPGLLASGALLIGLAVASIAARRQVSPTPASTSIDAAL